MAVIELSAYFDGSGKKDSQRVVTVGGAIAPIRKWVAFEKKWKGILSKYEVNEFHANKFAASEGEFKSWKGKKAKRSAFFKELVNAISENTTRPFGYSTDVRAWNEINAEYELAEKLHHPYVISGFKSIGEAVQSANKRRLEVFIEDGDDGIPALQDLCEKEFGIRPERLSKSKTVAFQAADLIAWKNRIAVTNLLKHEESGTRGLPLIARVDAEIESLGSALISPKEASLMGIRELTGTIAKTGIQKRLKPFLSYGQNA